MVPAVHQRAGQREAAEGRRRGIGALEARCEASALCSVRAQTAALTRRVAAR